MARAAESILDDDRWPSERSSVFQTRHYVDVSWLGRKMTRLDTVCLCVCLLRDQSWNCKVWKRGRFTAGKGMDGKEADLQLGRGWMDGYLVCWVDVYFHGGFFG